MYGNLFIDKPGHGNSSPGWSMIIQEHMFYCQEELCISIGSMEASSFVNNHLLRKTLKYCDVLRRGIFVMIKTVCKMASILNSVMEKIFSFNSILGLC